MTKFLICFSFIFLLAACGGNNDTKKEPSLTADTATAEEVIPTRSVVIEPVKINGAALPASLQFRGNLQEAWQWKDGLGDNLLITSHVAPYDDTEKNQYGEEGQTAELHAFHFVKNEGDYKLLWKISDKEKACPFDITCEFVKHSTGITDLDNDGIAETTLVYRLACRSDVSPSVLKLIMHEEGAKYGLRGLSWLKASPEDHFTVTENDANLETLKGYHKTEDEWIKTFGRYESEKDFTPAPPAFITHARREWIKFVKESFD